jgi:hypothetical protein
MCWSAWCKTKFLRNTVEMSNNFTANFRNGLENQPKTGTVSFLQMVGSSYEVYSAERYPRGGAVSVRQQKCEIINRGIPTDATQGKSAKKTRTKKSTRKVRFETVVQILRGSIFWIRQLNTRLRGSSTRKGCWRPRRILPVASVQLVGAWLAAAKFQSDWLCATEFQTRSGVQLSTPNETRCTLLQSWWMQ